MTSSCHKDLQPFPYSKTFPYPFLSGLSHELDRGVGIRITKREEALDKQYSHNDCFNRYKLGHRHINGTCLNIQRV